MEKSREKNNAGDQPKQTSNRGFAAMDPEYQRQIARDGGRIAHERGVAHKWTSEEAREAGRKGGQNSRGRSRDKADREITG
jgi:general stress protein YciG